MEENVRNSTTSRGGKHGPVDIAFHFHNEEAIRARNEVEDMIRMRNNDYDDIDDVLGVVDSAIQSPTGRYQALNEMGWDFSTGQAKQRTSNNEKVRTSYKTNVDEMRKKSTSGTSTSNTRQTTTTTPLWKKAAMAATLSAVMFIGGFVASDEINAKLEKIAKEWELSKDTKAFHQMVEENYTKTTFTGDTQIEYEKIAQKLEDDGVIDNKELYTMVAALGEVQANAVLNASNNAPATNVEEYMRSNNISNTSDWKSKTAQAMVAEEHLADAQTELNAIFKDSTNNQNTTENGLTTEGTYGGK